MERTAPQGEASSEDKDRADDLTAPTNSRSRAQVFMIAVRHEADVTPALLRQIKDPSPSIRVRAAMALGEDSSRIEEVLPALIEATADPAIVVRLAACRAIHRLGPSATPAVPALLAVIANPANADSAKYDAAFRTSWACVRDFAATVVVKLDPETYPRVVRLTAESRAAHQLATEKAEREKAVDLEAYGAWPRTVAASLADPRQFAMLGRMSTAPEDSQEWRDAAEKLLRALNGEDREVRRAVRYMFIDMRRDAAPLIEWACAQDNGDLHEIVQELVINLGPDGAALVPKLGRAMFRDPKRFAGMFVEMLSSVGTLTPALLDFLVVSSADKDAAVRTMVRQTLDVLRPEETALMNRVHNLLKSGDAGVRLSVVRAMPELPIAAETRDKMLAWIAKYDQSAEVRAAAEAVVKEAAAAGTDNK